MKLPNPFKRKAKETASATPTVDAISSNPISESADSSAKSTSTPDSKPAKIVSKSGSTKSLSSDELEQMVAKSISQVTSVDYVTLKVRKQTLLIVAGAAIITMWVAPFAISGLKRVSWPHLSLQQITSKLPKFNRQPSNPSNEASPSAEATTSAQPTQDEATNSATIKKDQIKIRIRNAGETDAGDALKQLLDQFKYQVIDVVPESNQSYTGVQIVVRRGDDEIRQTLIEDLSSTYTTIASGSAELTNDSDFDAVVILGVK